jgi:hypothetical protein
MDSWPRPKKAEALAPKGPCRPNNDLDSWKDPLPPARPWPNSAAPWVRSGPQGRNTPRSSTACLSGRPGVASLRAAVLRKRRCAVFRNTRPRRGEGILLRAVELRYPARPLRLGQVRYSELGEARSHGCLRRPVGRCPLAPHQKVRSTLWNPIVAACWLLSRTWASGVILFITWLLHA